MEKIRSIQVVNVRWFNATAWYALFLSRLLREAGHETLVLGLPAAASFKKAEEWGLEPRGLELNSANPLVLGKLYGQLRRIIADFRPHVVNCHRGEGFLLWGALKAAGDNFALVRTRGDQREPKNNLPNRILHGRVADAVIATNSRTRDSLVQRLGLPPEKVSLVPGGVDTKAFYPDQAGRTAVRAEFNWGPDDFVVGLVGRFDPVKGHDVLLEALRRVRETPGQGDNGRKLRLFLIGFGANISENDMLRRIAEAGLGDVTAISGRRNDINACLNALDLGVLASTGSEAIARAAVEIMACGVPLLSTNVGIMPDLLPDSLLIPPNRPDLLAESLRRAAYEPDWLEILREAGRNTMGHIKESDFLEQTLAVYRACLQ